MNNYNKEGVTSIASCSSAFRGWTDRLSGKASAVIDVWREIWPLFLWIQFILFMGLVC